jgi:uncharacterized membrane protein
MMLNKLKTLIRHLWWDDGDTRRHVPADMAQRLQALVAASESRHTGQIRMCVEAALPASYVWRLDRDTPLSAVVRQRALMMFSKLRVWDTEHNNGVLIYLLLAEHAIEIVADRALAQRVSPAEWEALVQRLATALTVQQVEGGLTQALEETSALLAQHFGMAAGPGATRNNELPDAPYLQ